MLTKEEYASYKAKYTKQAEDIRESVRVLKEKLTEVLENRSERNRWISQFTQFSTLETLDRRALTVSYTHLSYTEPFFTAS